MRMRITSFECPAMPTPLRPRLQTNVKPPGFLGVPVIVDFWPSSVNRPCLELLAASFCDAGQLPWRSRNGATSQNRTEPSRDAACPAGQGPTRISGFHNQALDVVPDDRRQRADASESKETGQNKGMVALVLDGHGSFRLVAPAYSQSFCRTLDALASRDFSHQYQCVSHPLSLVAVAVGRLAGQPHPNRTRTGLRHRPLACRHHSAARADGARRATHVADHL